MRLLDLDTDIAIDYLCMHLTKDEASELCDWLEFLLEKPISTRHIHLDARDEMPESVGNIIVATYVEGEVYEGFDDRTKLLIQSDK